MRIRNCPNCFGDGFRGHGGRCFYCHGKKKVSSDFVKWENTREKLIFRLIQQYEVLKNKWIKDQIVADVSKWQDKNPKPRKFPKT